MEIQFFLFLGGGTVAMMVVMALCGKTYEIKVYKSAIAAVFLAAIGYLGAKIMFFIESGGWSGRSLYGSIFLAPLLLLPVAFLLRVKYSDLMDISAPAECVMLALLKVKCTIDGCCGGRMITIGGNSFVFPSQIVECVAFIVIMLILIFMIKSEKYRKLVYPNYMIIYGVARFVLNLFRETKPWIGPLAAGNFWSIVSVVLGFMAVIIIKRYYQK